MLYSIIYSKFWSIDYNYQQMKYKIAFILLLFLTLTIIKGQFDDTDQLGPKLGYKDEDEACFPEHTLIFTKERGPVMMSELKIGDQMETVSIHSPERRPRYTKVTGWLHRDPEIRTEYLEIVDSNQESFSVSPMHNLATDDGEYVFAKNVAGVKLFGWSSNVSKIYRKEMKGAYAPMTEDGNYFILKSNGDRVLAHCFSNVENPTLYEPIVRMALGLYEGMMGASNDKIHKVGEWLQKKLSFIVEQL